VLVTGAAGLLGRAVMPALAAAGHAAHRRAASSAAGNRAVTKWHVAKSCHSAGNNAKSGAIKKSRSSALFWGLLWNNMRISIFGRTTLAIHRYSRFRR
jgi:NAD(P)-dependent dehydrogenase (short-subunit alcohol dehydrogenase family)